MHIHEFIYPRYGRIEIVVLGDLNVDAKADHKVKHKKWPYRTMKRQGWESNYMFLGFKNLGMPGTHGSRFIDYIIVKMGGRILIAWHVVLKRKWSDHRPVVAGIRIRYEGK
jgi:endonuclease/exonuclease/phosphatase family metal-dependent hydrolase